MGQFKCKSKEPSRGASGAFRSGSCVGTVFAAAGTFPAACNHPALDFIPPTGLLLPLPKEEVNAHLTIFVKVNYGGGGRRGYSAIAIADPLGQATNPVVAVSASVPHPAWRRGLTGNADRSNDSA